MSFEFIDKPAVRRILITVSKDSRQTERIRSRLRALFPAANVSAIVKPGQRSEAAENNVNNSDILYTGRSANSLLRLFLKLRRERFDLIVINNYAKNPEVDLQHTHIFSYLLRPRFIGTYTEEKGFELIASGSRRLSPVGIFLRGILFALIPKLWPLNIIIVVFFLVFLLLPLLLIQEAKDFFSRRLADRRRHFPVKRLSHSDHAWDDTFDVSIVIRTKNEGKCLRRTLDAVFGQDFPGVFEVIIVDSGSVDNTAEILRDYKVRCVFINPHEFTFGYSLNMGAKAARGKYIVNLSAHSPPLHNRWLANLIRNFDDPYVAGVYGRQVPELYSDIIETQYLRQQFGDRRKVQTKDFHFSNANCAILSRLWREERFDETLSGSEDREWANRLLRRGHTVVYEPEAPVYHSHHQTFLERYRRVQINLLAENRFLKRARTLSTRELFEQWRLLCISDQRWVLTNPSCLRWLFMSPIHRFAETFGYFQYCVWKKQPVYYGKR